MSKKPVLLCIMDGFGWTPNETYGNAVAAANKPFIDSLRHGSRSARRSDGQL